MNAKVSTEKGLAHVHVLNLDLDVIDLSFRLLGAMEFTART